MTIAEQVEAATIGADPQCPGLVLVERGDDVGGEAVAHGEGGEAAVFEVAEAAARADPYCAGAKECAGTGVVECESTDEVAAQAIAVVPERETVRGLTGQAAAGADPECVVRRIVEQGPAAAMNEFNRKD